VPGIQGLGFRVKSVGFGRDALCVSTFGDVYLNIPEPDSAEQSRYLRY